MLELTLYVCATIGLASLAQTVMRMIRENRDTQDEVDASVAKTMAHGQDIRVQHPHLTYNQGLYAAYLVESSKHYSNAFDLAQAVSWVQEPTHAASIARLDLPKGAQ